MIQIILYLPLIGIVLKNFQHYKEIPYPPFLKRHPIYSFWDNVVKFNPIWSALQNKQVSKFERGKFLKHPSDSLSHFQQLVL